MKKSFNNASVSNTNNKGVSMKKSKLIISDLDSNNAEFNNNLSTSFGIITSRAHYFMDYAFSDDEENTVEHEGADAHEAEYLEYLENKKASAINLVKAKEFLATKGISTDDMDFEVVELYAEQLMDIDDAPNAFSNTNSNQTKVTVSVQRLSANGHWYNVKDKYDNKIEFTFDAADIFELNEKGVPCDFLYSNSFYYGGESKTEKKRTSEESLVIKMKQRGFLPLYNYSFINNKGELEFKSVPQRFLLKSSCLKAGVVISGHRLEATVAPFFYAVDKEKNVVEDITYYGQDNVVEFGAIAIIPSSEDESHGDASNADFNDGIIYGTSQATQAMMSEDMAIAHIKEHAIEEAYCVLYGQKARRAAKAKPKIQEVKDNHALDSVLGRFVLELAPLTWEAVMDAELQITINSKLEQHDCDELMKALESLRRVDGKGFAYPSWNHVKLLIKAKKNKDFCDKVDADTITNIMNINKGLLHVEDLDDETVIKVREASVAYGKTNKACWIIKPDVSNAIKSKYAKVKGVKV